MALKKGTVGFGHAGPRDLLEVMRVCDHEAKIQGSWFCKESAWELVGKALVGDCLALEGTQMHCFQT